MTPEEIRIEWHRLVFCTSINARNRSGKVRKREVVSMPLIREAERNTKRSHMRKTRISPTVVRYRSYSK